MNRTVAYELALPPNLQQGQECQDIQSLVETSQGRGVDLGIRETPARKTTSMDQTRTAVRRRVRNAHQHLEDDVEAFIASHTVLLSEDVNSVSSDAANADDTGDASTHADAHGAGPSGHAPQQTVHKVEIVKKFVTGEAPIPWSETPRGQEWTKEWNTFTFFPYEKILAKHLEKADEMLINDDFKTQL
ncbi:hypothetical protein AgCh_033919 [Apium graveolens]